MSYPSPFQFLGLIAFAMMQYELCLSWPLNSFPMRAQLIKAKMQDEMEYSGVSQVETEKDKYNYQPPIFSESFLEHLAQVKGSIGTSRGKDGVECEGEPAIDPSRMVQDDGLDSDFLNDF